MKQRLNNKSRQAVNKTDMKSKHTQKNTKTEKLPFTTFFLSARAAFIGKKGPGENTGGLVPGHQKRSSIQGATSIQRSTYAWHAQQQLFREVVESFANHMRPGTRLLKLRAVGRGHN